MEERFSTTLNGCYPPALDLFVEVRPRHAQQATSRLNIVQQVHLECLRTRQCLAVQED
jgi:hypothetical protein